MITEKNTLYVETADSTNNLLKQWAKEKNLEDGFAVYAKHQTAGRGQKGNTWEAADGKNITLSIYFKPQFLPVNKSFLLSEALALGVTDALAEYLESVEIKYPNDIYYCNKKLAGILIENDITGTVIMQSVAGAGINVNQETFQSNAPNPLSLKQALGKEIMIEPLLNKIINNIRLRYMQLKYVSANAIVEDYHARLYRRKGLYAYQDANQQFNATIEKVSDDGKLHLITDTKEKRAYSFKEIIFIP
ncbi:MAG: biotin--[acetyl-CoA-carboxylase] ligase [Dysgonamonadaceae bacterium]|jgi:BirA family biotin operon repressor/biotin-[acetyl-CoA-carboxylase] ligase|nr:biotin--[acetyl-CoA-carboxylase] ligase [Dysgonamonadaceae bacterium]